MQMSQDAPDAWIMAKFVKKITYYGMHAMTHNNDTKWI